MFLNNWNCAIISTDLKLGGSLFQRVGTVIEKALVPMLLPYCP